MIWRRIRLYCHERSDRSEGVQFRANTINTFDDFSEACNTMDILNNMNPELVYGLHYTKYYFKYWMKKVDTPNDFIFLEKFNTKNND